MRSLERERENDDEKKGRNFSIQNQMHFARIVLMKNRQFQLNMVAFVIQSYKVAHILYTQLQLKSRPAMKWMRAQLWNENLLDKTAMMSITVLDYSRLHFFFSLSFIHRSVNDEQQKASSAHKWNADHRDDKEVLFFRPEIIGTKHSIFIFFVAVMAMKQNESILVEMERGISAD